MDSLRLFGTDDINWQSLSVYIYMCVCMMVGPVEHWNGCGWMVDNYVDGHLFGWPVIDANKIFHSSKIENQTTTTKTSKKLIKLWIRRKIKDKEKSIKIIKFLPTKHLEWCWIYKIFSKQNTILSFDLITASSLLHRWRSMIWWWWWW